MSTYNDLRDFIKILEEKDELKHITKEVSWDEEAAAVFIKSAKKNNRALIFDKVKDSKFPLIIGTLASPERIKLAIGKSGEGFDDFVDKVLNTKRDDFPATTVASAPCQEVVITGDDVDLLSLPIPKFNEKEGGRYITAGVSISYDPETGARNAGVYRMMARDKNELNVNFGFPNRHLLMHAKKCQKMGKPLQVAIALGCDPAVWLCAAMPLPASYDEVNQAGAIKGKGIEMVKGKTIDINVPATAEIILECEMDISVMKPEGPYNDFQGYYTRVKDNYVIKVKAITHRKGAIFETSMTGAVPEGEMEVYRHLLLSQQKVQLKKVIPQVEAMTFDAASMGHIYIVSVRNKRPFMANQIGSAILSFPWSNMVKMVIVVDNDIDIFDPAQVMWAIATRVDFEKDVTLLPNMPGASFDVGTGGRKGVSKMILDATMKLEDEGYPGKFPEAGRPSAKIVQFVRDNWKSYGLD